MKSEMKNNIIIVVSVIVLVSVGVALFYLKGSRVAVTFSVLGVPILFIAYTLHYIKNQKSTRVDPSIILKKQDIEKTIFDYKNILQKVKKAHDVYGVNTNNIESSLDDLVNVTLADIGVTFEDIEGTKTVAYNEDLITQISIENLDTVLSKVGDISKQLNRLIGTHVETQSNSLISHINELKNAGYIVDDNIVALQNAVKSHNFDTDFDENISFLDSMISTFNTAIDASIQHANKIKRSIEELNQDVSSIDSEISRIEHLLNERNFVDVIVSTKKVMALLESSASGNFTETKDEALLLINTLFTSIGDFDDEYTDEIIILKEKISSITSAAKISDVQKEASRVIPLLNSVLKNISEKISSNEKKIARSNSPSDFYLSNSESYKVELDEIFVESDLSIYTRKLDNLMTKMMPIFELSLAKSKVISAYNKIEKNIQKQLDNSGFVNLNDMRVKNADQFLELFALNNPEVMFDRVKNTLEFVGGRPVYTLEVCVMDDENKLPLEGISAILKKEQDVVDQLNTDSQGKVVFNDILKGNYNLCIDKQSEYNAATKKLTINNNTTTEVHIRKPSLGEKICGEHEDKMPNVIKRFTNELTQKMNEYKFIPTDVDIRVKPELMPCLLYAWAKENDLYKFVELANREYMVYDWTIAKKELQNIVDGLEPGDRESLDELRDGFFSAPLPSVEVIKLIEDLKADSTAYENVNYDKMFIWI